MDTHDCRKFEELIARYVHGEILRHEREVLERHLAECPGCTVLYGEVVETDRLIRSLPPADVLPPPWLHARIMANLPEGAHRLSWFAGWGRWGWSMAATSVGAILAVLLMRGGQTPSPVRTAAVSPSSVSSAAHEAPRALPGSVLPAVPPPAPAPAPVAVPAPVTVARNADVPDAAPAVASAVKVIHEIKIYLYAPAAQRVAVTGDFNGWDAKGVELKPSGKPGMWETDLELKPGAYAYNFIVDGDVLVPDPDSPNQMPDGFGGTDSILLVKEGAPA